MASRSRLPPSLVGWLQLGVQVVLALALFAVLQLLATRHNERFDLTPAQRFTLSPSARQVAAAFDRPARITVFYNSQAGDLRRDIADLLEQYRSAMPQLTYRLLDLDRSPALAAKYNIATYNTGVLESGEDVVRLRGIDETELTAALLSLTRTNERVVCFVTGHGERSPDDTDPRGGYSKLGMALARERFGVETFTTIPATGIPASCRIVVLAGPSKDLVGGEADALTRFLRDGGQVLLLVDPDAPPSVLDFLRAAGIDARTEIVVDAENRFVGADSFMPQVVRYRAETFRNALTAPAVLSIARPVGVAEDRPEDIKVFSIAATSPESWSLVGATAPPDEEPRFRPMIDQPGPISIGVLATYPPPAPDVPPGQLMVLGDSDFATNFYLDLLGNRDLILSAIAVLAEDPALIAVRQKEQEPGGTLSPISLTEAQTRQVFLAAVVATPLAVLAIGALVGIGRLRRRGGR